MTPGQLNSHKQKNEVELLLHIIYKNQVKWIRGLCARDKWVKLLEDAGINLYNLDIGSGFFKIWHQNQKQTKKIQIQWISTCIFQEHHQQSEKITHQIRGKTCKSHISQRICIQILQLNNKKRAILILKVDNRPDRHFSKEHI